LTKIFSEYKEVNIGYRLIISGMVYRRRRHHHHQFRLIQTARAIKTIMSCKHIGQSNKVGAFLRHIEGNLR